jgi:acyl transferase domain-containing protein/NAD(P)-dependent dehydrogenase (short-subunit alcohol dehydrogenase family)
MEDTACRAIAIVGVGAILPDAPTAPVFWENLKRGRSSISEVTPDRWDPALYYDPDPKAPDKSYSKIGGFVRAYDWDPTLWKLPVPPRVAAAMDGTQKWAVAATRAALQSYGWPDRPLSPERTAVILGNAMAGELHYLTALRINFPEIARELRSGASFAALPPEVREKVAAELRSSVGRRFPEITEDTMPGELANCMAGRIANLFNFRGPNFVCDAACASALAAISAAVEGLVERDFDAAISGGIDRNMGASTYVKFCKIGALSATGTRPYADGADGFVMGEGAALFVLKRLEDAERDGDDELAVLRGIGAASDGRGKGITAPNPLGQRLAVERAWKNAALPPSTASFVEGHGTSTRVGDVVEVESLMEAFGKDTPPRSIPLGSVKSNLGHLKGAAGAAGLLKTVLALHERALPPSLNFDAPNPNIDFEHSPFYVNTELKEWPTPACGVRRAGVSAFGFGGTNFHAVLEEHVPGRLRSDGKRRASVSVSGAGSGSPAAVSASGVKLPLRGALVLGAASENELRARLREVKDAAAAGRAPAPSPPRAEDLCAPERLAIDYESAADLAGKAAKALSAFESGQAAPWRLLRTQGVFRGRGTAPKVAFLYTGQGSQYVNMLRPLRDGEPLVKQTFAEADRVMTPLLGRPLSEYIFVDPADEAAMARAEEDLKQTAITQPAVLATDIALTRLLEAHGIVPDMVMGHSLGEYGALVVAGVLPFADALEAVSARGREMTRVSVEDNGKMAAVFAPIAEIEKVLAGIDGYLVIANYNSRRQAVVGGASAAVLEAVAAFTRADIQAMLLPVSHAFHTRIVAPASEPLRLTLERLHIEPPRVPVVANVTGDFYAMDPGARPRILEVLSRQVASPVQFVKGLETLRAAGVTLFVEVGPKRALQGFVDDVLADDPAVSSLFTNHPKLADAVAFNQALCGLYAAGLGAGSPRGEDVEMEIDEALPAVVRAPVPAPAAAAPIPVAPPAVTAGPSPMRTASLPSDRYQELGHLFAEFLERGLSLYGGRPATERRPDDPVVITGCGLGLPGLPRVFDDSNTGRLLRGEQLIGPVPAGVRNGMVDKHVVRLVKSEVGESRFESIDDVAEVIKLAGRAGALDLEKEFGVSAERIPALDVVTKLAIGAGLEALRDAGIPLVMRYKTTTRGTFLPDRWALPDALRDDTGVIFASAFPGLDSFASDMTSYHVDRGRREQLALLRDLRARLDGGGTPALAELDRRIDETETLLGKDGFVFDRRFLLRVLSMGHSQFAEHIGARGPNTQVNAACASTTQAVGLAEDWIRAGRCRRVIIVSGDDASSDLLMEWLGAGFLASGAAATDEVVQEAALPFDRRRHGLLVGMGAAALVVESASAARERGLTPICEVLSTVTANSAFHATRLDVHHISEVMESLVSQAESRHGVKRDELAPETVFVSHETYTPARGGSASAEVHALRSVFGSGADRIVMANTKGFTGHPMAVGIEDVVAVRSLETGLVPPVANFKEVDPDLGALNLSRGGGYPVRYALRLAAGFGSQISMALLRWVEPPDGRRRKPEELGFTPRIADALAFKAWVGRLSGYDAPELEVDWRTLRVKDQGPVARAAVTPTAKAAVPEPLPIPAPPLATPIPAVAASGEAVDPVRERILALVSEKTGYPQDMLALDLDLEADLGIDTVKQAELFASVREEWDIPRDEKRKLRDYPTLRHVVDFVHQMRPEMSSTPQPVPPHAEEVEAPVPPPADAVREGILALVTEKTGYPPDMLDLDLDLEADLGIDTVKQAELFASVREKWGIPRDENRKLRDYPTLRHVVDFVHQMRPELSSAPHPVPTDTVREGILALVTEKTGYPPDMLDLDLDLEADLGIDTVKQAELFASVREKWGIPRDENRKLRDYPTLRHVVDFVHQMRPELSSAPHSEGEIRSAVAPAPAADAVSVPGPGDLATADLVPRRAVVPVVRPSLSLCKPTGVTLGPASQVLVMADRGGVGKALARRLGELECEALLVEDAPSAEELLHRIEQWTAEKPIQGVYWLPALDFEGELSAMTLEQWREALRVRVKLLYAAIRALAPHVGAPGTFLVAATRLGGQHGYDEAGAIAPLGGAVTGFSKAWKREQPDALVKTVDFDASLPPDLLADRLVEETRRDPGVVEVGYRNGLRFSVGLQEQKAADGRPGLALGPKSVFLVTGAAGAIVSAITADLAAASGGTFHLVDLVREPDAANPDLARFQTDKDGLRRDIFERLKARGERATPALVEKEMMALERAGAALRAIDAVRRAGGRAYWYACDLRDAASVTSACATIRERSGRIDVLLHGAGLEISRFLKDKAANEFDLVFDVKCDGWFNVLRGLGDTPLGATVAFSSIAGRFGNAGQTDYSAANDLLCKTTSSFRSTRPGTRGIAIDWTAWADIGMASRGSIPQMMERAGIDMLPAACGVPVIRRELTAGGAGELVIAGRLGALAREWDETGGLDPAAVAAHAPLVGVVRSFGLHDGLRIETVLDPKRQPFLDHHRIEGTPVLPGVMGIESFAEAAVLVLPGWQVLEVDGIDFRAPFKFYRDEPRALAVTAVLRPAGDLIVADCRLTGERTLPGQVEPQVTLHFTAQVILGREARRDDVLEARPVGGERELGPDAIYRVYFHGPAYRVVEKAWRSNGGAVGQLSASLPPDHEPSAGATLVAPRLIELCFQTAGLLEMGTRGTLGLPLHVERMRLTHEPTEEGKLFALVRPSANGFDARVVDENGLVHLVLEGYQTVELPAAVDEKGLEPFRAVMSPGGGQARH